MKPSNSLVFDSVSFRYKGEATAAVRQIDLTVAGGRVIGVVGHNGAGKTTVLGLCAGLLDPSVGEVRLGRNRTSDLVGRGRIGLLSQRLNLCARFTVRETLDVFARIATSRDPSAAAQSVGQELGLDEYAHVRVGALSTGLKKRLALGVVLLGKPELLLLDEPFAGLDPISVQVVLSIIRTQAAEGVGIVVASHDLPELETIVDEIVVLSEGVVAAAGTLADMRALLATTGRVKLVTDRTNRALPLDLDELATFVQGAQSRGEVLVSIDTERASLSDVYATLHAAPRGVLTTNR